MNSYFRWYRMDDDLCVEYAEMRLGGQAKIYWENESHAAYRQGEPITSWVGMASCLRNKYVPRQYETTLFISWLDLRQGKMPVRDYIQAFEECRMRCRFVEDSRVVLGIFTHGLSPRLRNEVLKSNPSEVNEAYRIVEHMERPTEDSPAIPPTTTTKVAVTRPASSPSTVPTRASIGGRQTTPATSVGSTPPPRPPPTDVLNRATTASQAHITCFKCKGKGHRMSQCPSSNLLIEIEELGSGPPEDDVTLGDDIYIADEGLVDECEDIPGLLGYIQIHPVAILPAETSSPADSGTSASSRGLVGIKGRLVGRTHRLRQPSGEPQVATPPAASKLPTSRPAPAACVSPLADHRLPRRPATLKPTTSRPAPAACVSPRHQ